MLGLLYYFFSFSLEPALALESAGTQSCSHPTPKLICLWFPDTSFREMDQALDASKRPLPESYYEGQRL